MKQRTLQLLIGGALVAVIIGAVVYQSTETTVFFHTPQEVLAAPDDFRGKTIRIGALVEPGSTEWDAQEVMLRFRVTEDSEHFIPVVFAGVKPDMYREGQGVVVEGRMDGQGVLRADRVLVKHSEDYNVDQEKRVAKEEAYRSLVNSP